MSVPQTTEAVLTTAATAQAPTAVTAEGTRTWTQIEDTAPADQGSHRMTLYALVMVSKDGLVLIYEYVLLCCEVME